MSIPDLETYLPKVISWRRDLHMHPELGLQEVRTSNLIADLLTKFGLDVQRNFAGTAVLGTLHTNKPGKTVVLRVGSEMCIRDSMMPILQIFLVLRTIFPIIVLNFVEQ